MTVEDFINSFSDFYFEKNKCSFCGEHSSEDVCEDCYYEELGKLVESGVYDET